MVHLNHQNAITQAHQALQGLSLLAVDVIEKALTETGEPCALCGHAMLTQIKLKAATDVMDRVGLGPTMKVEHSGSINYNVMISAMTDQEFAAVDEIMQRVQARVTSEVTH